MEMERVGGGMEGIAVGGVWRLLGRVGGIGIC